MTDRELLEKAAKAAGVLLEGVETDGRGVTIRGTYWQPLHDDGDALRLAVKLGIQIRQYPIYETPRFAAYACESKWDSDAQMKIGPEALVQYAGDPYAATRLAIVRAAAQMAKDGE
jgi:hypothetical protein